MPRILQYRSLLTMLVCMAVLVAVGVGFVLKAPESTLTMPGKEYRLELADTPETRTLGLSGRGTMASDRGMVFVFDTPTEACFWMKDMRFPIDIIWLNESRKVTQVRSDVSPESYPKSFCADDTRYVIELHAGEAARSSIRSGDRLNLRLPQR